MCDATKEVQCYVLASKTRASLHKGHDNLLATIPSGPEQETWVLQAHCSAWSTAPPPPPSQQVSGIALPPNLSLLCQTIEWCRTIIECNWSEGGTVKWMMKERVNDLVTVCDGQIIIAVVGDFFLEFMRRTDHLPVSILTLRPVLSSPNAALNCIYKHPL